MEGQRSELRNGSLALGLGSGEAPLGYPTGQKAGGLHDLASPNQPLLKPVTGVECTDWGRKRTENKRKQSGNWKLGKTGNGAGGK